MSILARLFRTSEPPIDPATEAELDAYCRRMCNPFPEDWPISKREHALPSYVEGQQVLAAELLAELGLTEPDASALDAAWSRFLSLRRLVRSGHKVPRHLRSGRSRAELRIFTHRDDLPSLRLLERIGALFGVALQRTVPDLRWEVGHDPHDKYIHEGEPILRGFPGDFPEMNPTQVILTRAAHSNARSVERLSDLAARWVRGTTIPGLGEDEE